MFSIFKNKKEKETYFPFTTDIHSHILPGIDDGSPDMETSITLVKGMMSAGVKIHCYHAPGSICKNPGLDFYLL